MPNTQHKSALIAMSGGVDSSAAAYLMLEQGYRCEGTTMRLYRNEDLGQGQFHTCCSQRDIDDASEVAFQLDIPYEVLDFTLDFKDQIIDKFIRVYEAGGTPNPCIDCNRYMKFDKLLQYAQQKGLDYIVTGHYARIEYDETSGRYLLKKALDESKDQSYVLYMLTQEQLSRTKFPLGEMRKTEIRDLAERLHFINAHKHDSQDICFVPDGDYAAFMEQYTGKRYPAGDFLDQSGSVVGKHQGAVRYTLGQRKGLGLAMGEPVYVCGKDMAANTVSVGPESALYTSSLLACDMNWIAIPELTAPLRLKAKTRYRQTEQWATVSPAGDGRVRLDFDEPQRAVTAGQAVVLYDGEIVVGGGTILQSPATNTITSEGTI
jgi:tRNA-specific 2-thiouridylase